MKNENGRDVVTKLVILKNKRILGADNHFVYAFDWYSGDEKVYRELKKVQADELLLPDERYNLEELIAHKIECSMDINRETLIIEEIDV
jgi:hypothetical protein